MALHALSGDVIPVSKMPVFAHERLLPVHDALIPLFASSPDSPAGLVRGQTVVCAGSVAVSCALGLVAGVTQAGSWAAIVGMPSIGVLAAATIGVSLDRTVFVNASSVDRTSSIDRIVTADPAARGDSSAALSALVDGVDLVVVARGVMAGLHSSVVRRLQNRAQSKGSVLVIIGDPPATSVDVRLTARSVQWEGLGDGHGHLRRRLVSVEMEGRRCPRRRVHSVWLPDTSGALARVDHLVDHTVDHSVDYSIDHTA
jgi:threonine dehydrogenase-like Zn-dependent dehydrogenase